MEKEKEEKVRAEMNRSLTTIDDNLKGNSTELDNYSCSDSDQEQEEANKAELWSDNDSYSSSTEYDFYPDEIRNRIRANNKIKQEIGLKNGLNVDKKNASTKQSFYGQEALEDFSKMLYLKNDFIQKLSF